MGGATMALPEGSLFLGFDSSTQSLKCTVLDSNLKVVASDAVHFDSQLPHYATRDGVLRDGSRIVSPTLMWVEALDLCLQRLSSVDLSSVAAVSGSGQQHGSVYWRRGAAATLSSLDPRLPLRDQLDGAFAVGESPVWMDGSTGEECGELEAAVGGAEEMARITGSRAYERFTGPQIRRMFKTRRDAYHDTERISLVSSFMASLLLGRYAAIDHTDAAGMNLMDIHTRTWSGIALEATAPGLKEKLGELAPAHAVAGVLAPYFVERYNFNKNCLVIQWSGDNPNSLAGLSLNSPGDLAISLGTSDTVFGVTDKPNPGLQGHVFPNPVDPTCYMVMLCYKNGSLTREDVRNRSAGGSWEIFNKALKETPPLNGGKLGFYYKEEEILPPMPVGFHRYALDNMVGESYENSTEHEVEKFDAASEVRAIVEGQFLSMRAHTEKFGMPVPPKRLIATGGASSNKSILKAMATIFGCAVYTVERTDSASLGAALRAAHGWLCNEEGGFVPISHMYADKLETTSLATKLSMEAGDSEILSKYTALLKKRIEIENRLVERYGRR